MLKSFQTAIIFFFIIINASAQNFQPDFHFDRQDTLRGTITPERVWWDLTYYDLKVEVNLEDSTISGTNEIFYKVLAMHDIMQIDLQYPMRISRVEQNGKELKVVKDGSAWYIAMSESLIRGDERSLKVWFEGKPKVAPRAPWDGGFSWARDGNNKPFVATSNQGVGASIWWPNKDHPYDEPDSMLISVTVDESLMDVSNGRLREVIEHKDRKKKTWSWFVNNPINNYGVNINIGDYVHFGEIYQGEAGELTMDYYVLRDNLEKAKIHFNDALRTIEAFEYWFGPYPFYEDGYKLVEAPYLGMEHQSSVTYGNKYMMGYLGRDLSRTGHGLLFDFIIVHESGHEWFANNVTYSDVADMWLHEGFTNYSESLFLEYHVGREQAFEYVRGIRSGIMNDHPIIGVYNVNHRGSSDMYNKGSNLLHTLRQVVGDDIKWRSLLRELNRKYRHQTVSSKEVELFIGDYFGLDLTAFFNQYLRDIRIPIFEYRLINGSLYYRWVNVQPDFNMPVDVTLNGQHQRLNPTIHQIKLDSSEPIGDDYELKIDPNYYIATFRTN